MPAVRRRSGRVLLLDARSRVLLLRGGDPSRPDLGQWWFTVGGGCEAAETTEQAARRELREETGVEVVASLGPPVHHREVTFDFAGTTYEQAEDYFVARTTSPTVSTEGWTADERRAMSAYRWWSLPELAATTETVYPEDLVQLLARLHPTDAGRPSSAIAQTFQKPNPDRRSPQGLAVPSDARG